MIIWYNHIIHLTNGYRILHNTRRETAGVKMPKISIIIPVFNVKHERFEKTLNSLVDQTFKDFEVCISDGGTKTSVKTIIDRYQNQLTIKYTKSKKNLGISDNTNTALKLASGDYICFLDHDDILFKEALKKSIKKIEEGYDLVYTDEEIVDDAGKVLNILCKPDFSLDLLYSQNYICHFTTIRKQVIEQVGLFRPKYDGAQDYDYFLRVCEITDRIGHIPEILYKWLSTPSSTATNASAKPYAQTAGFKALSDHVKRLHGDKAKVQETDNLFVYKVIFDTLKNKPVDIIIPMKDKWPLTKECVDSIIEKTSYDNYRITILNNQSTDSLTYEWFNEIKKNKKVRIIDADFEFNWSKLQNFGIKNSNAEVFIFLNNDTIIIDPDWINTLCNNALRDDVGIVGPLLLYEDGTIQHAGVVIGMNGYADHVYKNCKPIHAGINYISPMVPRNVLAVTGACMAISKKTLDKIGLFDENFIICGSDVEICIRAYEKGLRNIYDPNTRLVHLESKSRETYVPPIDYQMSKVFYKKYWNNGDPFYNTSLDYNSCTPILKNSITTEADSFLEKSIKKIPGTVKFYGFTKNKLKNNKIAVRIYRKIKKIEPPTIAPPLEDKDIYYQYKDPAVNYINPIKSANNKTRINILIPSLRKEHVFGGISTAMKFFSKYDEQSIEKRIIVTNAPTFIEDLEDYKQYEFLKNNIDSNTKLQIVNISEKQFCNLVVRPNDIFIATAWWTAYTIHPIIKWQKTQYKLKDYKKLIYFIQDYEPYFYPWSSTQCRAESTYKFDTPTIAVFNSKELMDYFHNHNYVFSHKACFNPVLNDKLKKHLMEDEEQKRKKQIIIYGRPNTSRNAFEIINEALVKAFSTIDDYKDWKIISMGENHVPGYVKDGLLIRSVGKLSLDEYAKTMEESYLGISLMVSPHPSYPPLEMSSFGVKTITNQYENKDLSYFNNNIISVKNCDADSIAKEIEKYVKNYSEISKTCKKVLNKKYLDSGNQFDQIIKEINKIILP